MARRSAVAAKIASSVVYSRDVPRTTSYVLVPSPHAAFGVISDMDDTVLQSDATTLLRAARLLACRIAAFDQTPCEIAGRNQ